ncbi:LPS export ABC transporter ATP-binding protein [Alterinioella nitratireducens]|jgi:lipopolysaccharide export system ATP-binding protein|uniref:LPS export ABC transporter ATP-binding protein n=1 Tax=Alterinioella nitratireducens TaxID=2735915 RepID=UPI001555193A|nr:LPS export ABC transporter ATP-binding protein [Alterinioella nitratireducens]NPD18594.1 LPS export ABC transporter ATP-binding protein [Alterinioella nitratireducens]|tara:strand:- start:530 stop:1291 length:762 start_codon:yes stop_codon:yes gene_type:complete
MEGKPDLVMADGQQGLHVTNLRKSYRRRPVIRDVTLSLNRGEVVALLGPNGSGKTTCFYSIAGLVTPEGGTVMLDGQDVTRFPMYRRAKAGIGYLPQEMSIFRGLTVEANIMAILEITEKHRHQRHERLEELLSDFSISHLRAAPALSLSGGERRRAEIARCLASNPRYLLLDEPFAGVDPIAVAEIRGLVSDLKKRGLGVLITDHNVRETLEIVDRAYILHDGTVLMSGTAEEVVQDENVRRVYLGQSFRIT